MINNIISKMFQIFEINEVTHYLENSIIYWDRNEMALIDSEGFMTSLIQKEDIFEILLLLNLVNLLGKKEKFFKYFSLIERINNILEKDIKKVFEAKEKILLNMKKYRFQFDLITQVFEDYEFQP